MIPDSLFSPSQSPIFALLKVPFLPSPSPVPVLLKVPFQSSLSSFLLSKSSPLLFVLSDSSSNSRSQCSPSPLPSSSESRSSPLRPLSSSQSHLPSSSKQRKTAERHEAVPPFFVVVRSKMEHIRLGRSA